MEGNTDWGRVTGVTVVACVAVGFAIGLSGPLFWVVVGAGLAGGPSPGGLVLLLAVPVGALSGLTAMVAAARKRTPGASGSIFAGSVAMFVGILCGAGVGSAAEFAGWAPAPTQGSYAYPSYAFPSYSPLPPVLEANATVTLTLAGQPGYVATQPEPMGDGRFGQWCYSEPGNRVVTQVETSEVGRVDGYVLRIDLRLTDPIGLFSQSNTPLPRILVSAYDDQTSVFVAWAGQVELVAQGATSGTVRFTDLGLYQDSAGSDRPATVSGEVSWMCGGWQ